MVLGVEHDSSSTNIMPSVMAAPTSAAPPSPVGAAPDGAKGRGSWATSQTPSGAGVIIVPPVFIASSPSPAPSAAPPAAPGSGDAPKAFWAGFRKSVAAGDLALAICYGTPRPAPSR
jgi:hypothetical protein